MNQDVCKEGYDFSEEVTQSSNQIKILRLSADEEKTIGLKSGSILEMTCSQTISYPEKCE